ncbi:hypothetical protein GCM10007908_24320 [Rhizobium albus]|nr:hypothetical protein GCM10007908_24320 [Rhizobium albus]
MMNDANNNADRNPSSSQLWQENISSPTSGAEAPKATGKARASAKKAPTKTGDEASTTSSTGRKPVKAGSDAAASQETVPDYAKLGIPPEKIEQYEALRIRSNEIGRRSTAQVFEYGELVATLHGIADDQEAFEGLVKPILGLTRNGAENYFRVHRNLQDFHDRLVARSVAATVLYYMASSEPEKVEEALAICEAGEKLTVNRAKEILGIKDGGKAATPDDGGAAGLKARIAEKSALGIDSLLTTGTGLLEAIQAVLERERQGERLIVSHIQRGIVLDARLVRQLIESLTWLAESAEGFPEGTVHVRPLTRDDKWYALWQVLQDLGGVESWPNANKVSFWLSDTVVPQLEWMLGARAAKANAVIDKIAKQAEADARKAEKAVASAKLKKKKARAKARKDEARAELRARRNANKAAASTQAATAETET